MGFEGRTAQQMGAEVVRSSRDRAYHTLSRDLKRRVKRGDQVTVLDSGETSVVDRKQIRSTEMNVPETALVVAGTFPWIRKDVRVPVSTIQVGDRRIRLVDVSETDGGVLTELRQGLNGSTPRTDTLARSSLGEALTHHGIIKGALIIRPTKPGLSGPIFGVQSNGPKESTRVAVFITQPPTGSNDAYIVARSTLADSGRAARTIEARI